jgi:putative heme-binding domain-containing protein
LSAGSKTGKGAEFRRAVEGAIARGAVRNPTEEAWPFLVGGLGTKNPILQSDALTALRKLERVRPKADDPAPFRTVLEAAPGFKNPKDKWRAVELMRQWTGKNFGAEEGEWETELQLWTRWFAQNFPKEAPLPLLGKDGQVESKHRMSDLLAYLDTHPEAKKADVARGRQVFEKAQCLRCHKFGTEGEGVGPDLTALSKRFKRADILDSILHPSRVISDQYRSMTITTTTGQQVTGLAATQGDTVTVLLSDASKVALKRDDVESQITSVVSVMPENLLDPFTRQEVADLIAFLESEPR